MTQLHIDHTTEFKNNKQAASLIKQTLSQLCEHTDVEYTDYAKIKTTNKKFLVTIIIHDITLTQQQMTDINVWLELNDRQLLIFTDSLTCQDRFGNIKIISHPALFGLNYLHVNPVCFQDIEHNHPSRLYNCFIHRADSVRQSWFYNLYTHNLLDQGYVSYLCYTLDNYSQKRKHELFENIHYQFKLNEIDTFDQAYNILKSQIPFQNFVENQKLHDKILDSKYSLVLDSYAVWDDANAWFISEKICRSLMLPSLHLIFAQQGTLHQLAQLGIEIDQPNLDVDNLPWIQRQQQLCDQLLQDTQHYDYPKLKQRALHNYHLFKNLYDHNIQRLYSEAIDLGHSQFC